MAEADEEFVADAGYPLHYYLFRSDGPIEFHIDITRYFGPVDANGHLLQPENIYTDNGAVDLTLRVWDVDEDYSGSDFAPEVDKVYVVYGFLSSETTWSAWTNPTGFASQEGLHAEAFSFPNNHGSWGVHMSEEAAWVADLKAGLGVEKINIVGHSKGGLDSRAYLVTGQNMITLSFPGEAIGAHGVDGPYATAVVNLNEGPERDGPRGISTPRALCCPHCPFTWHGKLRCSRIRG
ncbi:MAG: esterase/lipase family protein [Bacillota bacterium]